MRKPITVRVAPFDIESAQPTIDQARVAFVRYLSDVPRKSTRSKHGLMGPVGKILGEVKSGRRDPGSLKGYAIRVHEANGRSPSATSLEALEAGIDTLLSLLRETPPTAQDRVLDRLDYGLYFDLRKEALVSKEARRLAWVSFLHDRYPSEAELQTAWKQDTAHFDDAYLPSRKEGSKTSRATLRQRDVIEFWESQGLAALLEEEDDE